MQFGFNPPGPVSLTLTDPAGQTLNGIAVPAPSPTATPGALVPVNFTFAIPPLAASTTYRVGLGIFFATVPASCSFTSWQNNVGSFTTGAM